ncbi:hypothetical protein HOY82DRAFT_610610 [Tuber indicum]|nr:hypothetical protein HOY82DRAFT_610610 [Tuber indicum]
MTIAENNGVTTRLVHHLQNIWQRLQALSDTYSEQKSEQLKQYLEESPDMHPEVGHNVKIPIFRHIYQSSFRKQMRRIDKWREGLGQFVNALLKDRGGADKLSVFERYLYHAVYGFFMSRDWFPDITRTHQAHSRMKNGK